MTIFKKICSKIRITKKYIQFKSKSGKFSGKNVFFPGAYTISTGRRTTQLICHFLYSGYNCYLDYPFFQYLKLDEKAMYASQLKGVFSAGRCHEKFSIIISDNKKLLDSFDPDILKIHINYLTLENKFSNIADVTGNDLYYPIGLHKNFLNSTFESEILGHVFNTERKIMGIFAGNTISISNPKKNAYNMDITRESLNINTRIEMLSYIRDKLPKEYLYLPDSLKSFLDAMKSGHLKNKIVLIDTQVFSIPQDTYFDVLLNSNFYIHMCGFKQPFCHNQIESMLAGCIPVTQFTRFFVPGFKHELNSLLFNTLDELCLLLLDAVSGKYENSLNFMREEIISYYKNYHSLESFKNKLSYLVKNNIKYANHFIVK